MDKRVSLWTGEFDRVMASCFWSHFRVSSIAAFFLFPKSVSKYPVARPTARNEPPQKMPHRVSTCNSVFNYNLEFTLVLDLHVLFLVLSLS
jgi:hypothetical protein